LFILSCTWPGR